jgi:hypothetical protein
MRRTARLLGFLLLGLLALARPAAARVVVDDTVPGFKRHVDTILDGLERSTDAVLRRFGQMLVDSPVPIEVAPITNDPTTWAQARDRTISHTAAYDGSSLVGPRSKPTMAIVYITPQRVDPRNPVYSQGILVHELTHALDLAYGHWNADNAVRERRACFMANVWSAPRGFVRHKYFTQYNVEDYTLAAGTGHIADVAQFIFTRSDLPGPTMPYTP